MEWRTLSPAERELERRTWPERMQADYEERAGIKEADGRMSRARAELEAFVEVIEAEYARREADNRRLWDENARQKEARRVKPK